MSEHRHCSWLPSDMRPCAHPRCSHGVDGFYLIVPVPADAMEPVRGRFGGPIWPDKRYRRVRHATGGEVWFTWMEEDMYEQQFGGPAPPSQAKEK